MALLVERPVDGLGPAARRVLLDLGRCTDVVGDEGAQVVGVVGGVGDDVADAIEPFEQAAGLWAAAPMSRRDLEAQRQTEGVDRGVDLGGQPASGATDRMSFRPPS